MSVTYFPLGQLVLPNVRQPLTPLIFLQHLLVSSCFACRCTCLNWEPASIHSLRVKRAAEHVVATVNNMTSPHARLCARLWLDDVMSAVRYVTNDQVLRFKNSADRAGRAPDLSDKMELNIVRLFPPLSAVCVYCVCPVNGSRCNVGAARIVVVPTAYKRINVKQTVLSF